MLNVSCDVLYSHITRKPCCCRETAWCRCKSRCCNSYAESHFFYFS